ncbi:hypothetical protein G7046_g7630 [Stylonectria norvegica]|nr:hypothetical protein G7046_g7630 [Stylonectria norvegica]
MPEPYPRPDFVRNPLRWESLNGEWDFLFDDDDAGISEKWQLKGLPEKSEVTTTAAHVGGSSESDNIVQRIASGTQDLIESNVLSKAPEIKSNLKQKIKVPFVFQSPASGINDRGVHEVLWYERTITDLRTVEEKQQGHRLVLRFGAVDYEATVWVDGHYVGSHRGGHVPFELDATDALDDEPPSSHRLTLRVYDSAFDLTQPRGKQYWGAKPESIFYTPSGGIWQSVFAEVVPAARIADSTYGTVIKSNDIRSGTLHSRIAVKGRRVGRNYIVEIEAGFAGSIVAKSAKKLLPKDSNVAVVDLDMRLSKTQLSELPQSVIGDAPLDNEDCWREGIALWSPEHPQLYDLVLRLFDESGEKIDEVHTTTGMRSLDWTKGDGFWRLNDKPYFQALCLDQGYWPDTFMTPPSQDSLKIDIELAKKMGLNGCRKHQKVEDPAFYYWADKLGYLVWAEMANAYQFSPEYVERFNEEWIESVKLVINRPSVVTWTPANESWGYTDLKNNVDQRNHLRSLYYITRTLDSTRSINENDGWEHVVTDLTTFHDYSDGPELEKTCASLDSILGPKAGRDMFVSEIAGSDAGAKHQPGAPIMCTEFGGVNIALGKDGENREWGYTTANSPEDLLQRIDRLIKAVVGGGHCCAFVYTQLADIEQEVNGLYTFDRKAKLDAAKVKASVDEGLAIFYARVKSLDAAAA